MNYEKKYEIERPMTYYEIELSVLSHLRNAMEKMEYIIEKIEEKGMFTVAEDGDLKMLSHRIRRLSDVLDFIAEENKEEAEMLLGDIWW